MTTSKFDRTLTEDFLARAAEDWISAGELIDLVRSSGLTDRDMLRDLAVGLVSRLICQELVVAGDVADGRHNPWDMSAGESIARVASEWSDFPDPFVMPGLIAWFDTTPLGQKTGEAIWRRESQ